MLLFLTNLFGKTHIVSSGKFNKWGCDDWTNNQRLWFTAGWFHVNVCNSPKLLPIAVIRLTTQANPKTLTQRLQSHCTHFGLPLFKVTHRALDKQSCPPDVIYAKYTILALLICGKEGACTLLATMTFYGSFTWILIGATLCTTVHILKVTFQLAI